MKEKRNDFIRRLRLTASGVALMLFGVPVQASPQDTTAVEASGETTRLQSISTISGERTLHRPVFQMEATLDGTLPGLYVNLNDGYPSSSLGLQMRQRNLLIVVDGVPRADVNLTPNQIESISIIKDGLGLARWGMSSGDGILEIKTKRGVADKLKIDFTAQYAQVQQMHRPKILDSYTYATLLNEAVWYDYGAPVSNNPEYNALYHHLAYSEQELGWYKDGSHPYTHPNNDWYSILMRDRAPVQQYNLNLSGGSAGARYFIDLNYYDQEGYLKQDKSLNDYDTREGFKKWSLRTAVDVNLTPNTLFSINLFGQMFRETTPGTLMSDLYQGIHSHPANAYPIFNPPADLDGKGVLRQTYGGNPQYPYNLYAATMATGYVLWPKTDLNLDFSLEHHFSNALKGLYAKGLYSYSSSYRELRRNNKGPEVWYYTPKDPAAPDIDATSFTKLFAAMNPSRASEYDRQNRLQYVELDAGYDFTFGASSSKTKLMYWNNQFVAIEGYLPMYKQGFNLHSEYDYEKKYMAEISLSTNSLNYLKKGKQWGFFPAGGLGWNIAAEDFFHVEAINTLKLRTTLGLNGNDGTGNFLRSASGNLASYYFTYMPLYMTGGNVTLGQAATTYSTLVEYRLPYDSQWEKSLRFVLGVDAELFDKSLKLGVEYFNNHHFDILAVNIAKNYSGLLGATPVAENFAAFRQQGLEFDLTYQNRFGDFSLTVNPLLTVYKSIQLVNGEPKFPEPYMQYVGRDRRQYLGQGHGYQADGFFQSQEEIDHYLAPVSEGGLGYYVDGYNLRPGDIKYKDLNNDKIIDGLDIDEIYTNAPRIEYGIYLDAGWKGLNLSMQWTGLANSDTYLNNMPFFPLNGSSYGNAYEEHLDYWRPDNPNASYPRLSAASNTWNTKTSTFWVKDNSYLRLKNIELSYSLPQKWMEAIRISGIKVFVNAYNLLTFSPMKDRDPEMPNYTGTNTPNFKAYNAGVNIQF